MSGIPYEVTAETLHPCQVAYVRRDDFLQFVGKYPEVYQGVVRQLSTLYSGACEQLRTVGLSASAPEKLARILLEWSGLRAARILLPCFSPKSLLDKSGQVFRSRDGRGSLGVSSSESGKWSGRKDLNLRPPGPEPGCQKI